tara:strand:+ start:713 stop:886 length:174 start_codon:yes stop_codon:yes gene_type:complete
MASELDQKLIECIEIIHFKIISMDKKLNKLYEELYINKIIKAKEIRDYEDEIGKIEP